MRALNALRFIYCGATSLHTYVSSPEANVLPPHTDPYDVIVIQLVGTKSWKACVPTQELGNRFGLTEGGKKNLSDSSLCQLQEMAKGSLGGCTTYSVKASKTLKCTSWEMTPGTMLYVTLT